MKYIILCGGMNSKEQKSFDKPRHLLEIKGEPIVARTIRLLRENGVENIAISTDDPELLRAVRQRQSELWNNACYKRVFGGK